MKIVILDRASLGDDTPVSRLSELGTLEIYESSTPSEVLERVGDAEVVIINKIKVTREVLDAARLLKRFCHRL